MPATKQEIIRHYALDRCFRNRTRRYYIEDLLEECNKDLSQHDCASVSKRTIQKDINDVEDLYHTVVDHKKDGHGRVYYRYADPDFSILKAPMTDEELAKLKDTVLMLNRFRGLPQFEWMTELLTKIEVKMHLDEHKENVISFDSNEYLQGLEYLEPLFNYIVSRQTIEMDYQPFDKPAVHWVLHPYHIRQFNNRWFLLAGNEEGQIMNVALDRIVEIKPANVKYRPTDIDFSEYFDDVIGVTILDVPAEQVLLKFTPHRLPYVLSKPLHPSQKTKDRDNGIIEITVKPNRELEALLLGYGDDVEVLQPEHLRREIQDKIQKMYSLYHLCK